MSAKNKRYFWLKLKDNFFAQPKIKKLRKIAGGDTYTIIFQKIMLLSIKDHGVITFEGIEDDLASELALILDEDDDNVKITLEFMKRTGLIEEVNSNQFLITSVLDLIGSETQSTIRSRKLREKKSPQKVESKKQSTLQCNATATQVQRDCNKNASTEKDVELKNNIVNNVVFQDSKSTPTLSLKIIELANIPEFTQDKVISDTPTVNQIDAIENTIKNYAVVGSKLFDTVTELCNTKADFFEDFNQILAVAINQQLEPLVQAKEIEAERANCKYKIDFRATEMANDVRNDELDDSQIYAIDHNLQYLKKVVGKKFDVDELKGWVTHSLKYGYKGLGFQKAMRCIVKAIKTDSFTRPYSLKDNYLESSEVA